MTDNELTYEIRGAARLNKICEICEICVKQNTPKAKNKTISEK